MGYEKLSLHNRTAVVIGGTSGIGRAIADGFADAGANVVCSSRRPEQVESTAAALEAKGCRTLRLTSDVGDKASLENLLRETVEEFGKVDILVNCAGRTKRAPTIDFPQDDWDAIIARHGFDVVLSPVEWPLSSLLKRDAGWRLVEDDGKALLF
ncbi:MAG TPA: SDR family NAD(P)-dependent oxidoreductase, partial [Pyrinomonadaceae bacterium]|nr:SDR family NAD(P)-dependent oxidoreductase [Pyrinomonadaceae bacterium]